MPETIQAKELPLRDIFDDRFLFRIPEYQRPYAWTTEETSELLDDLKHAASAVMSENADVEEASPYFLGSIVIVKEGNSSKADIVDGQQRITTLTILFCVLRDLASQDKVRTIHSYIRQKDDEFARVVGDFRLSVRERDKEFFRSHVQEIGKLQNFLAHPPENPSDSQRRMLENAKYLWDQVSRLDDNQRNALGSVAFGLLGAARKVAIDWGNNRMKMLVGIAVLGMLAVVGCGGTVVVTATPTAVVVVLPTPTATPVPIATPVVLHLGC